MTITISAGSWARSWLDGATVVEVPVDATAGDAVRLCGIPDDEIGMLVRNDAQISPDDVLSDGDELYILPVIIGG